MKVNWKHWLRQKKLYLAEAVFLVFQEEPPGLKNQIDCSQNFPTISRPPNMNEEKYEDMKAVYFRAYGACERYRQSQPQRSKFLSDLYKRARKPSILNLSKLKSSEKAGRVYVVAIRDFLQWTRDHEGDVRLPDELSGEADRLGIGRVKKSSKASVEKRMSEIYSGLLAEAEKSGESLTKEQAAQKLKKMKEFEHLSVYTIQYNYLKGKGGTDACKSGRRKKKIV